MNGTTAKREAEKNARFRRRVELLERRMDKVHEQVLAVEAILNRTFTERFRWLVLGR